MSETAFDKLVDKLPDIHFDWYARLIPGAFILLLFRFEQGPPFTLQPSWPRLILFTAIAYLIGHFIQPLSSRIARLFRNETDEKKYSQEKNDPLKKSETDKVGKAHAESVSMFSASIGTFVIWIFSEANPQLKWYLHPLIILCAVLFIFGVERVFARRTKIRGIK